MNLFDKLFKKEELLTEYGDNEIVSVVKGTMIPASEIKDPVFAAETLGKTIGIMPEERKQKVVSPANGLLEMIFPTGHAFGIKTNNGYSLMVHIGVDTVDLKGNGFCPLAEQGKWVKAGQPIIEVDYHAIRKAHLNPVTMIIVVEHPEGKNIECSSDTEVNAGDVIFAGS